MTAYRKMIAGFVVAVAACGVSAGALAADPTLDEVYQAVHQNRLGDAQSMMTQVLRDHPDSAKAHYVEAEVLARMNRSEDARAELARAEQIAPGLPFAKPEAVRDLQGLIDGRGVHRSAVGGSALVTPLEAPARSGGIPWGPIGLAVAAVALVLFLLSRARRPAVLGMPGGGTALGPTGTPYGGAPYPYGPAPVGGAPGIGSSIVGGLASGAALGAGLVAGEALAHNLLGDHERERSFADAPPADDGRVAYDDGGRDFGISGDDSWDNGGSGADIASDGGSDWS